MPSVAPTIQPTRPYYLPVGDEVDLFRTAYAERIPVLLKGPTGCGKTRFVEYMSWEIEQNSPRTLDQRLVTITCHEDMTSADLVGRYLLSADGTTWLDGPLTRAVREGAVCYLDEVVEARKDTLVVVHSLTDHRRLLPIERLATTIAAHDEFLLVVSYNPGYQSTAKELKPSTRQRFLAIEFGYPSVELESRIIEHEAGIDPEQATALAELGARLRRLEEGNLLEGPSTRLLVYAGSLIRRGVAPRRACEVSIVAATTDDVELQSAIRAVAHATFDQ